MSDLVDTVYPKKYAQGFCFAVLCCGYTLTDFPISIRLTSLALWYSNDCSSASKATLTNMDKYFMWIHYERLHNHNKAKHNKTVCIFLGIYGMSSTIVHLRRNSLMFHDFLTSFVPSSFSISTQAIHDKFYFGQYTNKAGTECLGFDKIDNDRDLTYFKKQYQFVVLNDFTKHYKITSCD